MCAYYWREPRQSPSFSFFHDISRMLLCVSISLSRSLFAVVFGAALIYRAESTSTSENIRPRRGVAWSDDECGIVVEGLVKEKPWREGLLGNRPKLMRPLFFPPLFRPFPSATCIDFFFLHIHVWSCLWLKIYSGELCAPRTRMRHNLTESVSSNKKEIRKSGITCKNKCKKWEGYHAKEAAFQSW